MQIQDIKAMPIEQRLVLMEQIWDSLCHENQGIASPLWHQPILEERIHLIKTGQARFISIQALKNSRYENH